MFKRLIIVALLAAAPTIAYADDTFGTGDSTGQASASQQPQSGVGGASALGPNGGTNQNDSTGSSNADASALQPAGGSSVQSTTQTAASLNGQQSGLQNPLSGSEALKVLAGEADGAPQKVDDNAPAGLWIFLALVFGLLVAGAYLVLRRYEQRAGY